MIRTIFAALILLSTCASYEGHAQTAVNRFRIDGATVVDESTGLRWQRCSVGQTYTQSNTCKGNPKKLNFLQAQKQTNFVVQSNGFWRVPTKNEIASLVDKTKAGLKIDVSVFPDVSQKNRFYWTCDMYADGAAWYADFGSGDVGYVSGDHSSADDFLAVRLVHVEW